MCPRGSKCTQYDFSGCLLFVWFLPNSVYTGGVLRSYLWPIIEGCAHQLPLRDALIYRYLPHSVTRTFALCGQASHELKHEYLFLKTIVFGPDGSSDQLDKRHASWQPGVWKSLNMEIQKFGIQKVTTMFVFSKSNSVLPTILAMSWLVGNKTFHLHLGRFLNNSRHRLNKNEIWWFTACFPLRSNWVLFNCLWWCAGVIVIRFFSLFLKGHPIFQLLFRLSGCYVFGEKRYSQDGQAYSYQ